MTCSTLPGANGSIWSEEYQCQLSYWIPAGTEKISGMPDLSDPQSAAETARQAMEAVGAALYKP